MSERGEKSDSYRWNSRRLASRPHTGTDLERHIDRGHTPWCSELWTRNTLYNRPGFVEKSQYNHGCHVCVLFESKDQTVGRCYQTFFCLMNPADGCHFSLTRWRRRWDIVTVILELPVFTLFLSPSKRQNKVCLCTMNKPFNEPIIGLVKEVDIAFGSEKVKPKQMCPAGENSTVCKTKSDCIKVYDKILTSYIIWVNGLDRFFLVFFHTSWRSFL